MTSPPHLRLVPREPPPLVRGMTPHVARVADGAALACRVGSRTHPVGVLVVDDGSGGPPVAYAMSREAAKALGMALIEAANTEWSEP